VQYQTDNPHDNLSAVATVTGMKMKKAADETSWRPFPSKGNSGWRKFLCSQFTRKIP
jgi:hypothetical protein